MKNIIIGTAGHIDHGKTTLIKALTGRSTDTLKEEIKRGISIDLGFTYFDLPSGKRAGIIDVPGHEKFIKNMLAGATGIDIVLLTIASDEGIKPQTVDHIDILSYLNIKKSIIVLTKSDLSDEIMTELIIDDIKDKIKDTFLQDAPIINVDSISKKGIDELVSTIDKFSDEVQDKNISAPPRLNIDRVFSLKGFGTIVTGTLNEGIISVDDEMIIYPQGIKTKVRGIKVHNQSVEKAYAGQRTALNIAGIKTSQIKRGCILAKSSSMSLYIDAKISLVSHTERELKFWERLRVYLGTKEVLARLVIMDKTTLKAGESAYCQLRLEEPVAAKINDPFVIRLFSPMETLGGGIVLDPEAKRHGKNPKILESLKLKEKGDPAKVAEDFISKNLGVTKEDLQKYLVIGESQVVEILYNLNEKIVNIGSNIYHINTINSFKTSVNDILTKYHEKFPFKKGMGKEELRTKATISFNSKDFSELIKILDKEKLTKTNGSLIANGDFEIVYKGKNLEIKKQIETKVFQSGYATPSIDELTSGNKDYINILESLFGETIVKLDDQIVLHKNYYEKAEKMAIDFLTKEKEMTLGEFRDMINSSRKYAVAILEDLDRRKITKMIDNKRVLTEL